MAVLVVIHCPNCKEARYEVVEANTAAPVTCSMCRGGEKKIAEDKAMQATQGLTIEQRLDRIERFIYQHGLNHAQKDSI
jgi:Zn finger protein HypA/HybF involved in hydrogenase expression